jgi:hypothetical protein
MEIIIRRRDIYVSLALIAVFAAWVAYALHDNEVMHEELEQLAEGHIDDWFEGGVEPVDRSQFDYLAIVDAEKAFTLFGRGWGVVHTYFREKGDEEFKTFKGIEFFYVRENGEWKMHDSAGCGAFEHHLRAFDAFMAQGVHVPNKVYNRALKIDFDYDMSHLNARNAADRAEKG